LFFGKLFAPVLGSATSISKDYELINR